MEYLEYSVKTMYIIKEVKNKHFKKVLLHISL